MKTFKVTMDKVMLVALVVFAISLTAMILLNDAGESFYQARDIFAVITSVSFLIALIGLGSELN